MVMTGYNVEATADAFWAERPPRNQSRSDVLELNLFDGGHGNQAITLNPILLGLGVSLRMALNFFTRDFHVFIQDISPGAFQLDPIEITSQFEEVVPRMYEFRGRMGFADLNPGNRLPLSGWASTVTLKLTVETSNVTLTTRSEALIYVRNGDDIRVCPEPRMDDFEMLQCLRENFLQVYLDKIDPSRTPPNGIQPTDKVWFFFEQSDLLAAVAPCICECFNYFTAVMVGVQFFIVGPGEAADEAEYPNAAGCNPWDGEIPSQVGGVPCVLPGGWELTGCSP